MRKRGDNERLDGAGRPDRWRRQVGRGAPILPNTGPGARISPALRPRDPRGAESVVQRHRPRMPFALLGLVILLCAAGTGVYGLLSSGFFEVKDVTVIGTSYVNRDDIVAATGVVHRNLWNVNTDAAQRSVASLSGVKGAEVTRSWPNTVRVTVRERLPVAVWQVGGVGYAVDDEGMVLDIAPDPSMLTVLQVDGARSLLPGDRVDGDAIRLARRVRDRAPATVGQQVVRAEWTQSAGLEVTTGTGLRVRMGDDADLDYKLTVWRGISDQARKNRTNVNEIDLRFGDRVYYR